MTTVTQHDLGRLLVHVCRLHHTKADQSIDQFGLYRGQAFLLMILSQRDGLTHSEIAGTLKISPAATTKVIKRMEQEGYLQRGADPADKRLSRVYLQAKGRALIADIDAAFGRLDTIMFDGLQAQDMEQFRSVLLHLQANLVRFEPQASL